VTDNDNAGHMYRVRRIEDADIDVDVDVDALGVVEGKKGVGSGRAVEEAVRTPADMHE